MALFGTYDRAALDAEYDNGAKVPDAPAMVDRWYADGEQACSMLSCDLDVPYGDHDRHRLDIFPVGGGAAPIMAFIHGGYWHLRDKRMAHFLAPTFVAAGIHFVSIGYRLCPEVTVSGVVEDVKAALGWVSENCESFGGARDRLYVAGHSAGGHLAATMLSAEGMPEGTLAGGCSISGLHDLEPIRLCYLNDSLHLDEAEAARLSPIRIARDMPPKGQTKLAPAILTVGAEEGPEYLRQRDELAETLRAARQPVQVVDVPGGNHFSACEAFGDHNHPLCQAMLRMIAAPGF